MLNESVCVHLYSGTSVCNSVGRADFTAVNDGERGDKIEQDCLYKMTSLNSSLYF